MIRFFRHLFCLFFICSIMIVSYAFLIGDSGCQLKLPCYLVFQTQKNSGTLIVLIMLICAFFSGATGLYVFYRANSANSRDLFLISLFAALILVVIVMTRALLMIFPCTHVLQ